MVIDIIINYGYLLLFLHCSYISDIFSKSILGIPIYFGYLISITLIGTHNTNSNSDHPIGTYALQ